MERYGNYKPSGVDWIGEIPEHWKICRFKNILSQITDPSESEDKIGLENIESNSSRFIPSNSEFEGNGIAFRVGDIVYGKLRPYLRKVWLAEFAGNAIGDFFIFRSKNNHDNRFIKYLILSDGFTAKATSATCGAKMPRVSSDFILTLSVAMPPLSEQQAIAEYLDRKCTGIDKVIETQERRIALLEELKQSVITEAVTHGLNPEVPLRDSGIDWIGKIPEHWSVLRLKYFAEMFGRIGYRGYTTSDLCGEGEGCITLSPSNMANGKMDFSSVAYLSWFKYNESPEIQIFPGDILFVKTGSTYGKSAYVENIPLECTINPQILRIVPKINNKFAAYLFETPLKQAYTDCGVIGSTIPTISQECIGNFRFPIPPLSEQQAIVECLDRKCANIDNSISKARREIKLLQELKQTIITEAVTGKVKVC